uniref:Secreted protein n=1 Tax=Romanomermis culicivorax TaxID=13658 RepID=A0A915KEY6_ROMCU
MYAKFVFMATLYRCYALEQCSMSVGNAIRRDSTFAIGDGPAHSPYCATYSSANGASFKKSDAAYAAAPRCSGFGTSTDTCLTAATKVRDIGHFKPINNAENDWGHQHSRIVPTQLGFIIRH